MSLCKSLARTPAKDLRRWRHNLTSPRAETGPQQHEMFTCKHRVQPTHTHTTASITCTPTHDNARKTQPANDALTYYQSLHSSIIRGPSYHPFTRPTHDNIAIHASTLRRAGGDKDSNWGNPHLDFNVNFSMHRPLDSRGRRCNPGDASTKLCHHSLQCQLLHASAHPFTPLLILRRRGTWSKVPSSRYVTCVTPPASVVPVTQSFLRLRPDRSWSSKIYDNYTVPNRSGCRSLQQSNRTGKNCCDVRSALGMPRDVAEAIVPRRHGSLLAPAA